MALTVMVSFVNLIDCIFSCQITTTQIFNKHAIDRTSTTTPANQENRFCCSAVIRQSLIDKGVSIEESAFIISSWRKETTKQYMLCWRKWVLWCGGRVKNPFAASKIDVVEYLIHLVNINSSYSVINTHKSMLMQTLLFCGASWCNNPTLIPRFMKVFLF